VKPFGPHTPLVLASRSAARAALLRGAGLTPILIDAGVDETAIKRGLLTRGAGPREIAHVLAEEKAKAGSLRADGLVIGADQTLDLERRLFDKPQTLDEARSHLQSFRGKTHHLHSGLAVASAGEILFTTVESVALTVRLFSDAWLDSYLDREGEGLLASVGAYQLEGSGVQLFEKIEGDYFTVLGLPLLTLLAFLRAQGVTPS
jgi:septum formation protein